jgi:hypothetical protein
MRVVDLLELAAPEPTRPFDHAVVDRARRDRRRRWAWFAGMVVVGGAAVPTTAALLPASHDGATRVETIEPKPHTDPRQPEPGTVPTNRVAGATDLVGSPPSLSSGWPVTEDAQPADAPEAEGCATRSTGTDVYAYPAGVVGTGEHWTPESCSYAATADGGYRGTGAWTIRIERDGQEIRFSSTTSPSCGTVGTIRRGDKVTLTASEGSDYAPVDQGGSSVEAGPTSHC